MCDNDVLRQLESWLVEWSEYNHLPSAWKMPDPSIAYEIVQRAHDALDAIPKLPAWCFQPENDTPGLFIACRTAAERDAIIRALKGNEEPPEVCEALDG